MLGDFGVEGVGRDIVRRRQQPERGALDDPVDVSLSWCKSSSCIPKRVEIALHFETDASAMAAAALGSFVRFLFHDALFNAQVPQETGLS